MRGLKYDVIVNALAARGGRTPPGVRGLKSLIEQNKRFFQCRTPPGVRGLKFGSRLFRVRDYDSRTPPGVRGLKSKLQELYEMMELVAPHPGCVD